MADQSQSAAVKKEEEDPARKIGEIEQTERPTRRLRRRDDPELQARARERRLERQRKRQEEEKRAADEGPKIYAVVAANRGDITGNKDAQKLIEQKLKDAGIDNGTMIVMQDVDRSETFGWCGLQIGDEAIEELKRHPAVGNVVIDSKLKKRRNLRTRKIPNEDKRTTKVDKRALDWDRLQWYKDGEAEDSLIIVSQYPGKPLSELNHYIYEQHRGQPSSGGGVFIYVIDEGIEVDVTHTGTNGIEEFPKREPTLFTSNCIHEGNNQEDDEDQTTWHGTTVASLALGQMRGVAKGATLVPVKYTGTLMAHVVEGLILAENDIRYRRRVKNSIVVLPVGDGDVTDPQKIFQEEPAALGMYAVIDRLMSLGVPVITPAGNERRAGYDVINFYPSYFEGEDYPIINVAETDHDGIRSIDSLAGNQVTTWAATSPAAVMYGNGNSEEESGTSMGCGVVAGVIAGAMAFDEPPWGGLEGRRRVEAIRGFIKSDPESGWKRPNGERVIWNGATREYHDKAVEDPNLPNWPSPPQGTAAPQPTAAPPPPKGEPKSLQIIYEDFFATGHFGTTKWRGFHFWEGKQGEAVDPCGSGAIGGQELEDFRDRDKIAEPYTPDFNIVPHVEGEWNLRFSGYAKDCKFQGLGRKGEAGDVGWLHCPERPAIKCVEAPEVSRGRDGWTECQAGKFRVPSAYCDWS